MMNSLFVFMAMSAVSSCSGIDSLAPIGYIDSNIDHISIDYRIQLTVNAYPLMALPKDYSPHPQGGDCWGDYFFQFSNNNGAIRIYDLEEKKFLQKIILNKEDRGFVDSCHCNSVCFGSSFYEEGDYFPLLYVSTGYSSDGYTGALVYRVEMDREKELFSFSLVQTLRFPGTRWTEFIPAGETCFVCFGRTIYEMPLPSVHRGDTIIDCNEGAINVFQFSSPPEQMRGSSNQGRLYHNGRIIFPSGIPPGEPSVLVVLDLENRSYEQVFNLPDLGLLMEAESIFIWRNSLCIAFLDQIVLFEFSPNIIQ